MAEYPVSRAARLRRADKIVNLALILAAGTFIQGLSPQIPPIFAPALAMSASELDAALKKLDEHSEHKEVQTLTPIGKALAFSHSKQYQQSFSQACADGRKAIDNALVQAARLKDGSTLAVVSDLDETLLDNRPFFDGCADKEESQINWDAFEDWQKTCDARPLKYTEEMLAYARSKGLAIFFITGRMERLRRPTIENLIKYGIAYDGLYMRANGDQQNASTMKAAYRKQIEDMGFKIVVNIGDQYSDLSGGHSLDCEKLPNKIYFIR